jgi:hypothetical protein
MTPGARTADAVRLVARARLRRHWVGIVVVGLIGALGAAGVLALVAGARRTSTAYERLRATTRAFDGRALILEEVEADANAVVTRLRLLPEVESSTVARLRVGRRSDTKDWISTISVPALDAADSRPQLVRGRSFTLEHPNEAVVSQATAEALGLDIGDVIPIDYYSNRQFAEVLDDFFVRPDGESVNLRIVGVTREPDDATGGRTILVGASLLAGSDTTSGFAGVRFRLAEGVSRAEAERAIRSLAREQGAPDVTWAADTAEALESTRDAIVAGLLVAAGVLALAAVIAVMQAAARQVDQCLGDRDALAALGLSTPGRIAATTLPGGLAGVIAAVGGVAGAVALSPLFPTGRIHAFEPHPGVAVHLAILGVGLVLVAALVVGAFAFAAWRAEQRAARVTSPTRPPSLVPRAHHWPLGATSFMGTRFAIERGPEQRSVPVRTSLAGIATGVAGVVAALTFAASLDGFLSEPAHYGQPWDLSIETLGADRAPRQLAADREVEAAAVVRSLDVYVEDRPTTLNSVTPLKGSLAPTLASGRLPEKPREIALGPRLLARTGSGIGDTVVVRVRTTMRLRVVGTALNLDPQDETFGTTGFVTPATLRELRGRADWFNEETALRFHEGVDVEAATRRIKEEIPLGLTDESLPDRPPAVDNVAELGRLPEVLAVVLAIIGLVAVGHAVVLAVRRRRRELAVLAALGMTRWQRARIVMAMAGTMVGLGLVIGIPIGALVGVLVWGLIARDLRVDWAADVPALTVIGIAAAAVVITLVIALLPARNAGRVGPAAVLRSG